MGDRASIPLDQYRRAQAPLSQPPRSTTADDLKTFTPAAWEGQPTPRREWIIDGLLSVGNVLMISGDGGHGKSLLAQQLLTALPLGHDWLGYRTKRVRTWGMFCEDDPAELQRRQADINQHYGTRMGDIGEDFMMTSRVDRTSFLCQFEKWGDEMKPTPLWHAVERSVLDFGAQVVLFDTARKTFGGNEIRDGQVSRYIGLLRRLAIRIQGSVIFTLHPSNEGISSGSGIAGNRAWRNEVRSMAYLTDAGKDAETKPNERILRVRKSNYGPPGGKVPLIWRGGVFERSDKQRVLDYSEPRFED